MAASEAVAEAMAETVVWQKAAKASVGVAVIAVTPKAGAVMAAVTAVVASVVA